MVKEGKKRAKRTKKLWESKTIWVAFVAFISLAIAEWVGSPELEDKIQELVAVAMVVLTPILRAMTTKRVNL